MSEREERKTLLAVAVKGDPREEEGFRLTAKGKGRLAEKIVQLAIENGVLLEYDPDLVEILSNLDLDEELPPELQKVMVEILAFLYELNEEVKEGARDAPSA